MPGHTQVDHDYERALSLDESLTLHDVVEKTYQRNPRIEVIQARLKHVAALEVQSKSLVAGNPSLTVNHYNDEISGNRGLQEWEVGLSLPIWWPGQKSARQNSSARKRDSVTAHESVLKLEMAGITRELLWDIALKNNSLVAARQEWDVILKLEQDVEKRVELGDLALTDLILAQQESLSKEAAWRLANQEFHHAQHRYSMITGLEMMPQQYEELVSNEFSITVEHPALKALRQKVNHSTAIRDQMMIEKKVNPTVFLGTRHERSTSKDNFVSAIGLSISMPFGMAAHTTPKVTQAEVTLSEDLVEMELLNRELNLTLQNASLELTSTREQYEFLRRQNELAKKNLALSRRAFALGETGLIELIRIQSQSFNAERNMQQKYLEVGLHKARLNQAMGIIP